MKYKKLSLNRGVNHPARPTKTTLGVNTRVFYERDAFILVYIQYNNNIVDLFAARDQLVARI